MRGQARGGNGKDARGEKHQPLRDHPNHGGDGGEDGVIERGAVHEERAQEEANTKWEERIGAQSNDCPQRVENLGAHGLHVLGLGVDTRGIAILPHLGHAGEKVTRVNEAAA